MSRSLRNTILALVLCVHVQAVFAQNVYNREIQPTLQNKTPDEMKGVDIGGKLGEMIPLDVAFKDEEGQDVTLRKYFDGKKPVLLNFAYSSCVMLCHYVLDATMQGAKGLAWTPGNEYQIVTVIIDEKETPAKAKEQKMKYLGQLRKQGSDNGWHFLTGNAQNIRKIADAVGFYYKWDEASKQYSHAAAIMILSGEGKLSRYLYGIRYEGTQLRNALIDASDGKVGTTIEKAILWCFHYDPKAGTYIMNAQRVMKAGMGIVLVLVMAGLFFYWRREKVTKPNEWEKVLNEM